MPAVDKVSFPASAGDVEIHGVPLRGIELVWGKTGSGSKVLFQDEEDHATESLKQSDDSEDAKMWLPLWQHLEDTAACARWLWDNRTPISVRQMIASDLGVKDSEARAILELFAVLHDVGKASPGFYTGKYRDTKYVSDRMLSALGLELGSAVSSRHEVEGADTLYALLRERLDRVSDGFETSTHRLLFDKRIRNICGVIAGHHGVLRNTSSEVSYVPSQVTDIYSWDSVRNALVEIYVSESDWKLLSEVVIRGRFTHRSLVLLTGLLVVSDWLASSELFPLFAVDEVPVFDFEKALARRGVSRVDFQKVKPWLLPPRLFDSSQLPTMHDAKWFDSRFGDGEGAFTPRAIQSEVVKIAEGISNDILVVEASTGGGKTYAALAAAEVLMQRSGKSGFFFGMPTMTTSNAVYRKIRPYLDKMLAQTGLVGSSTLTHSKDGLSIEFREARELDSRSYHRSGVMVGEGFYDPTRPRLRMLNSFVVGTVDQSLMAVLKSKYNYLRLLGLASKVVVVDEVHAADSYMVEYLKRLVLWAGVFECPVVLLSATLTDELRDSLVAQYVRGREYSLSLVEDDVFHSINTDNEDDDWEWPE